MASDRRLFRLARRADGHVCASGGLGPEMSGQVTVRRGDEMRQAPSSTTKPCAAWRSSETPVPARPARASDLDSSLSRGALFTCGGRPANAMEQAARLLYVFKGLVGSKVLCFISCPSANALSAS